MHLLRVILNLFLSWIEGIICLVIVYYISSVKAGFADDTLIFCNANIDQMLILRMVLI